VLAWCDGLPALVSELAARWDLDDDPCRVLTSTATQLRSFLLAVKAGEFDGVTA
jgi:hypothetical protein